MIPGSINLFKSAISQKRFKKSVMETSEIFSKVFTAQLELSTS